MTIQKSKEDFIEQFAINFLAAHYATEASERPIQFLDENKVLAAYKIGAKLWLTKHALYKEIQEIML